MKKLLFLLIVGVVAIAWRMPEVSDLLGLAGPALATAPAPAPQPQTELSQAPMTAAEFMALSKTDPQAYQKYLNSHVEEPPERSEVDKFLNLLSRGSYE